MSGCAWCTSSAICGKPEDPKIIPLEQFCFWLSTNTWCDYSKVTIREALQELVAWSQTAELKLVDHEERGRRTALIRDWSDIFLELGDKQSLLASLKESQFFKTFEDQGITYEVGHRD